MDSCWLDNHSLVSAFHFASIQASEMLVSAGKSTALRVLHHVMARLHQKYPADTRWAAIHPISINPKVSCAFCNCPTDAYFKIDIMKALTIGALYGEFDPLSHEFKDGVLSYTFRQCASGKVGQVCSNIF
jgi:hypothetical protein